MRTGICIMSLAGLCLGFAGCSEDSDESSSGNASSPGTQSTGPCSTAADCPTGHACIQVGQGQAGCMPTCSASVDSCGASAQCAGVGALDVNICQEPEPEPDPMNPPEATEQPRIPCQEDAECAALNPGAICAEWMGQRDCTLPCTNEAICDPPMVGGLSLDFFNCQDDERADQMRTACLPRIECLNDPLSCLSGIPGFDGGGPDVGSDGAAPSGDGQSSDEDDGFGSDFDDFDDDFDDEDDDF